jgi:magnesium-transporting ATPase (P-type)
VKKCEKCGADCFDGAIICYKCKERFADAAEDTEIAEWTRKIGEDTLSRYKSMGGWLLFFMIVNGLAALKGFIDAGNYYSLFTALKHTATDMTPAMWTLSMIAVATLVASALVSGIFVILVCARRSIFLKIYQITSIASLLLSAAMMAVTYAVSGAPLNALVIVTLCFGVAGLFIMTLYYCRSVRVRVYMGGEEHKRRALFRL